MSIRTEVSIRVERVAKPLKNKVWTDERNRLGPENATMMLCVGLNLRFLYESNQTLKAAAAGRGKT